VVRIASLSRDSQSIWIRLVGSVIVPDPVVLLFRALVRALASRTGYDDAATALATELTSLSGRRVLRRAADGRLLLDLLGFVPVVGTVVDVCDVLTYGSQGRWEEAGVTVASAVPGPVGWVVTAAGIVSSLAHMGEVAGIERTAPTPPVVPVVPVAREVSDSTPVRVSEPVPARGPRRRRPRPTSPRPP
jgi:hypothetical protein